MKTLINFFRDDRIQRIIYGIGLILWILIWFKELIYMFENDSYSFYWWTVLAPIPLLIGQIILNSKFIWNILMIYSFLYSLGALWNAIMMEILIDSNRDFSPEPFLTSSKFLKWLGLGILMFIINAIIWNIEPNSSNIKQLRTYSNENKKKNLL